jgi:hypothetical protein
MSGLQFTSLNYAAGAKVRKTVLELQSGNPVSMEVDYWGGFQYKGSVLQFFPMSEGYIDNTLDSSSNNVYNYVFQYKDHLGNVRLSYGFSTSLFDGSTNVLVKEQNHYYPFGLKHMNYNMDYLTYQNVQGSIVLYPPISTTDKLTYNYKFGGKEYQEELGMESYDFGARNYDPALGR